MPKPTLNFGSLSDMIGVELRYSQISAEKTFISVSGEKILPGHFTILMLIKNNPGQTQTTLSNAVHLDRSSMVPIINYCEQKGWVERKTRKDDRRAYALHLTHKGQRKVTELEKSVEQLEQRIKNRLGKKNRKLLINLLRQLQDILND